MWHYFWNCILRLASAFYYAALLRKIVNQQIRSWLGTHGVQQSPTNDFWNSSRESTIRQETENLLPRSPAAQERLDSFLALVNEDIRTRMQLHLSRLGMMLTKHSAFQDVIADQQELTFNLIRAMRAQAEVPNDAAGFTDFNTGSDENFEQGTIWAAAPMPSTEAAERTVPRTPPSPSAAPTQDDIEANLFSEENTATNDPGSTFYSNAATTALSAAVPPSSVNRSSRQELDELNWKTKWVRWQIWKCNFKTVLWGIAGMMAFSVEIVIIAGMLLGELPSGDPLVKLTAWATALCCAPVYALVVEQGVLPFFLRKKGDRLEPGQKWALGLAIVLSIAIALIRGETLISGETITPPLSGLFQDNFNAGFPPAALTAAWGLLMKAWGMSILSMLAAPGSALIFAFCMRYARMNVQQQKAAQPLLLRLQVAQAGWGATQRQEKRDRVEQRDSEQSAKRQARAEQRQELKQTAWLDEKRRRIQQQKENFLRRQQQKQESQLHTLELKNRDIENAINAALAKAVRELERDWGLRLISWNVAWFIAGLDKNGETHVSPDDDMVDDQGSEPVVARNGWSGNSQTQHTPAVLLRALPPHSDPPPDTFPNVYPNGSPTR